MTTAPRRVSLVIPAYNEGEAIVARTGAHVREGDALFEGIELPPQMPNHALTEHVLAYFP